MEGCWLVAAPGRACCGCWLVAALGTGACLLGAAPRDGCCWLGRGACVLLRDVPVTAERGAAFLARSARSMSAALSRRSLCQRPPGGASFRSRRRRGSSPTRPPGEGCVADPSLASTPSSTSRGGRGAAREDNQNAVCPRGSRGCANRADRAVSSPRAACAAASRRPQPNAIAEKRDGC